MLSVVKGVEPRDQVEAMLAAQMAAVHTATMTFAGRLAHVGTKLWFSDVCEQYELEAHHVLLLTIACDAWDNHSAILLS